MAITAGMSKCVGAACVRGVVMKELVLGRHHCVYTSLCTSFHGEYLQYVVEISVWQILQRGFINLNPENERRVGIFLFVIAGMRPESGNTCKTAWHEFMVSR